MLTVNAYTEQKENKTCHNTEHNSISSIRKDLYYSIPQAIKSVYEIRFHRKEKNDQEDPMKILVAQSER